MYASGIWSHGNTGDVVVDEATPPKPAALVAWRQAVEDRVLAGAKRGIRTVVLPTAQGGRTMTISDDPSQPGGRV